MNKRKRNELARSSPRRPKRRLKALGRNWMFLICTALLLFSAWEICVRLDAMYKPVKMFFNLVVGENIPIETAMSYFDWSILEPPLYLAGCILVSLIALFMSRRPVGSMLLIPLCGAFAAYGLTREGTVLTDLWRLVQPALLLLMTAFGLLNLLTYRIRRRRFINGSMEQQFPSPHHDSPRLTDAPRLRGISYPVSNLPESAEKNQKRTNHIA